MALRILPYYEPGVPHISLVFREMWDSTALRLISVQVVKGRPTVAPHISRKTSEIWGTRFVAQDALSHRGINVHLCDALP